MGIKFVEIHSQIYFVTFFFWEIFVFFCFGRFKKDVNIAIKVKMK